MNKTKRFEQCVYEDLPEDKVSDFILQSEKNHPKLKYEARPAKSGKLNHKDIWSYLKLGKNPKPYFFPTLTYARADKIFMSENY